MADGRGNEQCQNTLAIQYCTLYTHIRRLCFGFILNAFCAQLHIVGRRCALLLETWSAFRDRRQQTTRSMAAEIGCVVLVAVRRSYD